MTMFSSRPPFNDDPCPWMTLEETGDEFRTHTAHENGIDAHGVEWEGWTFKPRPEFDRPQHNPTNRMLVEFREYWMYLVDRPTAWHAARYLEIAGIDHGHTDAERIHTRRVLTRLANLEKMSS